MKTYRFLLGLLTVWRLTHLLQAEDGPGDLVIRFRGRAGEGFWGRMLDCFYCLSVWVAAPLALVLGKSWGERALPWPSLSAGAILLDRLTKPAPEVLPAPFIEEPGEEYNDAMLRTKTPADEAGGPER